jgi:hypothetical protein
MNLIDSASLVVTPNGYKASKLYSIVPTDGTGDMTFTRAGDTATRVNPSGLIAGVNANIPRLDYLGSTCPKVLLEPQRTNIARQSEDISSLTWGKVNAPTIVANAAVSPDGTTDADTIQDTTGITTKSIVQAYVVAANSTHTFSLFVKKETTKTNFGGLEITYYGVTEKKTIIAFDEVTGTLTNLASSAYTPILRVENYGTYWRISATVTDTFSNTVLQFGYYPVISLNGTTVGVGAGSVRTIWGAQLEAGSFATSYIPTTTASVTRNADTCSKTSVTALIGQTEGTLFREFTLDYINTANFRFTISISNGTYANSIGLLISTAGPQQQFQAYVNNNGTIQSDLSSIVTSANIGTRYKLAIAYKVNDIVFYINGVQIGIDTSATIPLALSRIDIGTIGMTGLNALDCQSIKSAAIWKTRLTNTELATLTTL